MKMTIRKFSIFYLPWPFQGVWHTWLWYIIIKNRILWSKRYPLKVVCKLLKRTFTICYDDLHSSVWSKDWLRKSHNAPASSDHVVISCNKYWAQFLALLFGVAPRKSRLSRGLQLYPKRLSMHLCVVARRKQVSDSSCRARKMSSTMLHLSRHHGKSSQFKQHQFVTGPLLPHCGMWG